MIEPHQARIFAEELKIFAVNVPVGTMEMKRRIVAGRMIELL